MACVMMTLRKNFFWRSRWRSSHHLSLNLHLYSPIFPCLQIFWLFSCLTLALGILLLLDVINSFDQVFYKDSMINIDIDLLDIFLHLRDELADFGVHFFITWCVLLIIFIALFIFISISIIFAWVWLLLLSSHLHIHVWVWCLFTCESKIFIVE